MSYGAPWIRESLSTDRLRRVPKCPCTPDRRDEVGEAVPATPADHRDRGTLLEVYFHLQDAAGGLELGLERVV